ncbi:HYR domain-containing protein [Stigmatella sp. ncwal1]|uniref:HYR domain-containing protein n=1 Tax=Stigmatella ashevillensis TaxID=2995309 RepID=A0ABT5DKR5_9BACT|nr:ELWxxDGT repeat protein [Stigmatella ashevillena]MDC0714126.1 HYR domain-containing protein [Stigmatella ashevillena]
MWSPRPLLLTLSLLSVLGGLSRLAYADASVNPGLADDCGDKVYLVKDIAPRCSSPTNDCDSAVPTHMVEMGGVLFFQAFDGEQGVDGGHGTELWKSNGQAGGTEIVLDIAENSDPKELTVVADTLFFVAREGEMYALWKTDGSKAGTQRVKQFTSDPSDFGLTALGNTLFFKRDGMGNGAVKKLWKSNGLDGGTVEVNAAGGMEYSNPQYLTALGNQLYFQAENPVHGAELWKSDGTEAGTRMVADLLPGLGRGSNPSELTVANGRLFFLAADPTDTLGNNGLWKTSGSEVDTELIVPAKDSSTLGSLTAAGDKLFFTVDESKELRVYRDVPGAELIRRFSASISQLTYVHGVLFFARANELWRSDGTKVGTQLVKAFDTTYSIPLIARGPGMAIFVVNSGTGYELWKSNGQTEGTQLLHAYPRKRTGGDVPPTDAIVSSANKLFFAATQLRAGSTQYTVGDELYAVDFKDVDCTAPVVTPCQDFMTVEALTPQGAQVYYLRAPVTDNSLAPTSLTYTPASGSLLPWSETVPSRVEAVARDGVGNETRCTLDVYVKDTISPRVLCPEAPLIKEAESLEGTRVTYDEVSASDAVLLKEVSYSPPSGSLFPIGRTDVEVTARDGAGKTATCAIHVEVRDRVAPSIECPGPQTFTVPGRSGGRVELPEASARDNLAPPEVSYSPERDSLFPEGETVVTATATDSGGNTASCTFQVTVVGEGEEEETPDKGCGCQSGSLQGGAVWLLLMLLPAWARRRAARLEA